ncbi:MAG TPA: hypothetical protein VFL55_14130 [Acetobacteraceae bacterium]|nr:hypothetical protein [Acetobacteraceae bacterium]
MEMQSYNRPGIELAPFPAALRQLQALMTAAMPAAESADALDAVRELFEALAPRDAAEAYLAAIAAAAAHSSLDSFIRAARPGLSDETAARLRSAGLAGGRAYASAFRMLRRRPEKPKAEQAPAPEAAKKDRPPGPSLEDEGEFQPRDRFGKPIPTHRTDLMTRKQVEAVLAYPRDAGLEAAAVAEEEAMIAEQATRDVGAAPPPSG